MAIESTLETARRRMIDLTQGHAAQLRIIAEADAKKAAEKEASEKRHAERLASVADARLTVARRAFLAAGGSDADWEKRKDTIAAEIATQAAVSAGRAVSTGIASLVDVRSL